MVQYIVEYLYNFIPFGNNYWEEREVQTLTRVCVPSGALVRYEYELVHKLTVHLLEYRPR